MIPSVYTFLLDGSLCGSLLALIAARLWGRPRTFMLRLFLWLMPATAVCMTAAYIIWISLNIPCDDTYDGIVFLPFLGAVCGIGLYLFALPFVSLARFSPFWRERLVACLSGPNGKNRDRTAQ